MFSKTKPRVTFNVFYVFEMTVVKLGILNICVGRRHLQTLLNKWNDCDDKMCDLLGCLRTYRELSNDRIPCALEHLHAELIKCRDAEIMLNMSPGKTK